MPLLGDKKAADALAVDQSAGFSVRSGAGAIPLTHAVCKLTTTGAEALTLALGVAGQKLRIVMVVNGGVGTLTFTAVPAVTELTFGAVGEFVDLEMNAVATSWAVTATNAGITYT